MESTRIVGSNCILKLFFLSIKLSLLRNIIQLFKKNKNYKNILKQTRFQIEECTTTLRNIVKRVILLYIFLIPQRKSFF